MNKKCLNWNIFEDFNVWNIIILVTQDKNKNSENDDEVFKIILRGVETRISKKTLTNMFGAMRIDDESNEGYYVLQLINEPYTLQEDKEMEGYIPPKTDYSGELVYDVVFLNPVPFAKHICTHP